MYSILQTRLVFANTVTYLTLFEMLCLLSWINNNKEIASLKRCLFWCFYFLWQWWLSIEELDNMIPLLPVCLKKGRLMRAHCRLYITRCWLSVNNHWPSFAFGRLVILQNLLNEKKTKPIMLICDQSILNGYYIAIKMYVSNHGFDKLRKWKLQG